MRGKINSGYVRCSPLFVILCIFAFVSENAAAFLMHMGALLLHESAHFVMARMLGCSICCIDLLPYGCRMEITKLDSPWDELMIALSGPVCSLICFIGCRNIPGAMEFAEANMYIAIINLLPAYPLDGGRAINALFSLSGIALRRSLRAAAAFILSAIMGIAGFLIKNITMVIFAVFLLSEAVNLLRERGNDIVSHMKNLRCAASGKGINVRHIALREDVSVRTALSYNYGGYTIFCILDDDLMEIARIDSARLAQLAAEHGSGRCLGDILPFIDRSK